VDYQRFITTVQEQSGLPAEKAKEAACATLHTLAQRISIGETKDLADRLPLELRPCLKPEGGPEPFDFDAFLSRVEDETALDGPSAEEAVRAVFAALWSAVGPDEFADMRSQLPKDFYPLLEEAVSQAPPPEQTDVPFVGALPYEEFLGRLAERTGLDRDQARLAAEAVLEALAIRLSAGEIDDIEPSIPPELRPALVRGRVRGGTRANPLPFEEFIDMIARREGVTSAQATEHARAVLAVLREAVGEKEFRDMKEQLPASYRVLFAQNTSSV
jgi:uncharacterized protein (DUF2267 family)